MWLGIITICWLYLAIPALVEKISEGHIVAGQLREISHDLDCFVRPRRLIGHPAKKVSDFLLKHEEHEIIINILAGDAEAGIYGSDISRVLVAGGWRVIRMQGVAQLQEGVSLKAAGAFTGQYENPRHPSAVTILQQAFGGIIQGGGSGGETVSIDIGHRPFGGGCDWAPEYE